MDIMNFQILEDGTITVKTSDISDGNHMSADALMAELDQLMGGKSAVAPNTEAMQKAKLHKHAHKHGFAHNH